ncbi:hypothetical protein KBC77_01405 [Candidatus Saccharibacteria bacterium]|nr:hypothetical protein [Candidatus Saccharibacteria bacterium]
MNTTDSREANPIQRTRVWFYLLLTVFAVFVFRLFYLQVIRHDYYTTMAASDQLREYNVLPERGTIYVQSGGSQIPLVLNQRMYTISADPTVIKKKLETAKLLTPVIGQSEQEIVEKLKTKNTRYVVLKKKLDEKSAKKLLELKVGGIVATKVNYRIYPQGSLASQVLGFVDEDGNGKYGIEEGLNKVVGGKMGKLKAVTDVNGVPLAANNENFLINPENGKDLLLTINMGMQAQLEQIAKRAQEKFNSKHVSAIVMETKSGKIRAMANYPTFDPGKYTEVQDANLFQNYAATQQIEPGSITKVLSAAAALDSGAVTMNSSFYDPGKWVIDEATVTDVDKEHNVGTQTVKSTLDYSLNTGATWFLMQMGGGRLNEVGRSKLYDYYTNKFNLGSATGIEQGYEAEGYLVGPKDTGSGIDLTYANMAFGQAYSASAVQMVGAFNSIINGGTYYRPQLVEKIGSGSDERTVPSKAVRTGVVSQQVGKDIATTLSQIRERRANSGFPDLKFDAKYFVGGKSGTAQIAKKEGGYREDRFNGTYLGFVGGDSPEYSIIVYNIEPAVATTSYAGTVAGQTVWAEIAHMLVNNYGVTPRKV